MPQENPTDFPGFLETTDRKVSNQPSPNTVDPENVKCVKLDPELPPLTTVWIQFRSDFAPIRPVYLNYILADEALMFPFFFFFFFVFLFILSCLASHKFEQFSSRND